MLLVARHLSDFVQHDWPAGRLVATVLYIGLLAAYVAKEIRAWQQTRTFNLPRNLLMGGTVVSWYFGIVQFNGDLAFTLLNVVAHGIPYLALVWTTSQPSASTHPAARVGYWWTGRYGWLLFLGVLFSLAYLEEGVWDGLVWREHGTVFQWFQKLPPVAEAPLLLALLVPLLALPQMTHYVLDGFIWRRPKQSAPTQ